MRLGHQRPVGDQVQVVTGSPMGGDSLPVFQASLCPIDRSERADVYVAVLRVLRQDISCIGFCVVVPVDGDTSHVLRSKRMYHQHKEHCE